MITPGFGTRLRGRIPTRLALAVAMAAGLSLLGGARPVTPTQAATAGAPLPAPPGREQASASYPDYDDPWLTSVSSTKWAGFFVTAPGETTDFTGISASWTVTSVTCLAAGKQWAGFWVGMDGWWNNVVEQGGTEAICVNGRPQYRAWWEMFPAIEMQGGFAVRPGDQIHAAVTYRPGTRMFSIVVQDRTSGRVLRESTPCRPGQDGCPRTSAEVISEDVRNFSTGRLYPLPDYGTQTDTGVLVTDAAGHTGPLSDPDWELRQIADARPGTTLQATSALGADGSSFTTRWLHG